MPTYDFQCPKCLITFEIYVSVSLQESPRCDCGELMQKQYSSPGIIFKGEGWASKS
jgi:putative FmdB family regulatory protein